MVKALCCVCVCVCARARARVWLTLETGGGWRGEGSGKRQEGARMIWSEKIYAIARVYKIDSSLMRC